MLSLNVLKLPCSCLLGTPWKDLEAERQRLMQVPRAQTAAILEDSVLDS